MRMRSWNGVGLSGNEAGDIGLLGEPTPGWTVNERFVTVPNPPQPVSKEPREVEFDVMGLGRSRAQAVTLPAHALYYVCEDARRDKFGLLKRHTE